MKPGLKMKEIIEKFQQVKWIAHRGLPSKTIENTLVGFKMASNLPFFGIETDVHQTVDNVLVLHHDDNLIKLTGKDIFIDKIDYDTIKDLRLKDTNHAIPKLSQYLQICKESNKVAIIELKAPFTVHKINQIIDEVNVYDYLPNTIFISFYVDNLMILRDRYPHIPLQLLTGKLTPILFQIGISYHLDFSIYHKNVTKQLVDQIHDHQRLISTWTVNSLEDVIRLVDIGVDFITTDGF